VTVRFKGTIDLGGPEPAVAVGEAFDFFVARYAAADGALVWAKTSRDGLAPAATRKEPGCDSRQIRAGHLGSPATYLPGGSTPRPLHS
jgi:hypothetical protein